MDKFSVIIPTLWKSKRIHKLLRDLIKSDYVGEIILIDNNKKFFETYESLDKVVLIQPEENIYVNPAWNMGVNLSKCNNITIANDDINFNVDEYYNYFEQLLELNDFKNLGFIGSHSTNYEIQESSNPTFEVYNNKVNKGGWGCLFSFEKSNWKPIPSQLKIWYGDNWIHMVSQPILNIVGIKIETEMSTTSELSDVRNVRDNDIIEWRNLVSKILSSQ